MTEAVNRGRFITLEGGDGAGKTTQARLLAGRLKACGLDVLSAREPGGTPVANAVRAILVAPATATQGRLADELMGRILDLEGAPGVDQAEVDAFRPLVHAPGRPLAPMAEALLHLAARADHWAQALDPMLAKGYWVICDRFSDSTLAYQGGGGGLGVARLRELGALALPGVAPDLTIILDVAPSVALERARLRASGASRYEERPEGYHAAVRAVFRDIAAAEPARCRLIDASLPAEDVHEAVWAAVAPLAPPARAVMEADETPR